MPDPPKVVSTGWFAGVAFDTNHLPFILWDTDADLKANRSDCWDRPRPRDPVKPGFVHPVAARHEL
jgi:hypothetical protein